MTDKRAYSLMPVGSLTGRDADPRPGQRPVVLVIDSEMCRREDLSRLLGSRGYTVLTARNGEDALALVARGGVVLVISSLVMPRMDGLELLRVMRERQPLIPVIAIASGDKAIDQVYLRGADVLGAARTFSWPMPEAAFLESVEALLDQVS